MSINFCSRNISSIELAGLPGAGKSQTSLILREEINYKNPSFTRSYINSYFKKYLSLILSPLIIFKFHRVFSLLLKTKLGLKSARLRIKTIISILGTLCSYQGEYFIASLESSLQRKRVFLDGGYVQWSLSIWLRSPVEIRQELWLAYLSHIPKKIVCVILECEPEEALKRASSREEGVPKVISTRAWDYKEAGSPQVQYEKMAALLRHKKLQESSLYLCAIQY